MKLRDLKLKDAPLMLEWMHDKDVVENLRGHFLEKTIDDAIAFIKSSSDKSKNVHYAICSDEDEYMGTVSLKNIEDKEAEFAITVRKSAMGKGYSWWGMKEILKIAFEEYGLESVYWCVSAANERAVKFYNKHNFKETLNIPQAALDAYRDIPDLKWYVVYRNESY